MKILDKIRNTSPVFRDYNEDIIKLYTLKQGGKTGRATETDKWEGAKYFSTVYEIYMYSIMLGLKNDYKVDIEDDESTSKFIEIKHWKPEEISDFILSSIVVKKNIDLFDIDNLEEDSINNFVQEFRKEIESYSNGGFEIIREKQGELGDLFKSSEYRFLELIEQERQFNN